MEHLKRHEYNKNHILLFKFKSTAGPTSNNQIRCSELALGETCRNFCLKSHYKHGNCNSRGYCECD